MVYAHLFLFKLKISLWELQGFGTRQIGEINCFMYWLCSPFSLIILFIPLVKNISALAENDISNCVSTDVKSSSQNSMDIPETGNRISLSLVCFCQIGQCLALEPEVKVFTLCVSFDFVGPQYLWISPLLTVWRFLSAVSVGWHCLISEILFLYWLSLSTMILMFSAFWLKLITVEPP